ncbi:MAG: hypothetical protein WD226_04000 [Planctomycetota bacterium]
MISAAALLAFSGALVPHSGPPLDFRFVVDPGHVALRVRGEQRVWDRWLGLGETFEEEVPPSARQALLPMAEALFTRSGRVKIDGVEVAPTACSISWWLAYGDGFGTPGLELWLTYEHGDPVHPKPCESIAFTWREFAEIDGRGDYFERIPVGFEMNKVFSYGDVFTWEPTHIWHAVEERDRLEFVPPAPPPPLETWRIPLAALALLALGVLGAGYLRLVRAPGAVIGLFLVLATGAAWALRDRAVHAWVPFGERRAALPTETRALELFERLHTNVYAAFGAERESDIYDILARSVTDDLLDDLYTEIYTSLILREEGGAVCEIERLEPFESVVSSMDAETATFTVDHAWRVYGSVFHYGHGHQRINQYKARYYVMHDGAAWRIAAVDTREHLRIGDDAAIEVLYLDRQDVEPDGDGE